MKKLPAHAGHNVAKGLLRGGDLRDEFVKTVMP
jgi:hypothetical protein